MERDSFVFYRSFAEAIWDYDDDTRLKCYDAIIRYALEGKDSETLYGVPKTIFTLIKPQLDANNKKYINGKKGAEYGKLGGRPKKEKENPTGVIEKNPTGLKGKTPNVNENENENENVNEKEKDNVPYQQIADMYNETCVSFPRITKLSDSRKKAIKARLKKYSLDDIQKVFTMAEQSDFLKGSNNRNWSANFDWLMNDTNIAKVLDGNYNSNKPKKIDIDSNFRNFLEQNEVVNFGI